MGKTSSSDADIYPTCPVRAVDLHHPENHQLRNYFRSSNCPWNEEKLCFKENVSSVFPVPVPQTHPQLCSRTLVAPFPALLFPSPVDPTDLPFLTSFFQSVASSHRQPQQASPTNWGATAPRATSRLTMEPHLKIHTSPRSNLPVSSSPTLQQKSYWGLSFLSDPISCG